MCDVCVDAGHALAATVFRTEGDDTELEKEKLDKMTNSKVYDRSYFREKAVQLL